MNQPLFTLLSKAHDVKLVIDGIVISLHVEQPLLSASKAVAGAVTPNVFRLVEGKWHIRFNGRSVSRKRSVALTYIHELLKHPHGSISPTELLTTHHGESPLIKSKQGFVDEGYAELSLSAQSNFAEPILPDDARRRMLRSLDELKDEFAHLQDSGENVLALEKQEEIEKVEDYLRESRFGNHNARFSGRADRDRKSVSVAIARAIENICKDHHGLARHLDNSIRTGKECRYDPETETKWVL
jgi:hypothetical protein